MRFLSGVYKVELAPLFTDGTLGLMCRPGNGYRPPDAQFWAADNGCFGKGYPGDEGYLEWLADRQQWQPTCLFATAPDVVGAAAETLARSAPLLPLIRELGYRPALVAQDGLEHLPVPWDTFDVLFIGGTTRWKLSPAAVALTREARDRGKGTHVGRVNFAKRIRKVRAFDAVQSIDGTRLRFGHDKNLPQLLAALADLSHQGMLM